jgi:hypothetical protein
MMISGSYKHIKDQVSPVILPVSPYVIKTTFANVASSDYLYFDFYISKKFFNCWELSPSLSSYRSKFSGIGIQNEGTGWSTGLYSDFALSNFRLNFSINYSSSSTTAQEKTKPEWSTDAGAKLLLLHKALSITLKVSDLFNTRNKNSDNIGTGFTISNNIKETTRIISLSISYFFRLEAQDTMDADKPNDVLPEEF